MTASPHAPTLSYLARIDVEVGKPIDFGVVAGEHRRIVPILGGTVSGPSLRGRVLPAGADFQVLRSERLTELEARYGIETDSGDLLYITNTGIRAGEPEDIARLSRGEFVEPEKIYFRSLPRLSASAGQWEWLNHRLAVGTGIREPDRVRLDIFIVD